MINTKDTSLSTKLNIYLKCDNINAIKLAKN